MSRDSTRRAHRWSVEEANRWYAGQHWVCGVNYVPSYAANTTELWQESTWNLAVIDRELGWAGNLGLNAVRVFIQFLVWRQDRARLLARVKAFLDVADKHGIRVMLCLLDDCAFGGKQPRLGPQEEPISGVHNSCWTPSPGHERVVDGDSWSELEDYVSDVVGCFADDWRVWCWDVYNEPGNGGMGAQSLPLLEATFRWTRRARPTQPVTSGLWCDIEPSISRFLTEHSDVISFHDYDPLGKVKVHVNALRPLERPLLCTEWMARHFGSRIETVLPWLKEEGIACFSWGLVNGRTQTHYPWESQAGGPEPSLWFHDLLRPDGRPYDLTEIEQLRALTGASA